jgi:uncharacterized protein involved in type VI secretion and phage assembly
MSYTNDIIKAIITRGLEVFQIYYSSYRGYVVDNEDPKNLHRVKLQVPQIFGNSTLEYWAYPKGLYAGPKHGFQMIPKIGEMVWVEFEFGNSKRPIWTYGHRGVDDYVDDYFKDKNVISLRTKIGHQIIIDETNEVIRVVSSKGKVVEISDKINLGEQDGKDHEKATLGDTTQAKLEELADIIAQGKITTMLGPQIFLPDTQAKILEWKNKLGEIKSDNVTLMK